MTTALRTERTLHVGQGDHHISAEPDVVMSTILGSCIAACIRDPGLRLGGMNHFLLPEGEDGIGEDEARRYGVNAMEILINSLLRAGARRDRLQAKLFGGGAMFTQLRNIGAENAAFAHRFLDAEGIPVIGGDTGGTHARRIRYRPATGQAMQRLVADVDPSMFIRERTLAVPPPTASHGDLELF